MKLLNLSKYIFLITILSNFYTNLLSEDAVDIWKKTKKLDNQENVQQDEIKETDSIFSKIKKNPNIKIIHPPEAKLINATNTKKITNKLISNGARYNHWSSQMSPLDVPENETKIRLACSWCTTELEINKLLELFNY